MARGAHRQGNVIERGRREERHHHAAQHRHRDCHPRRLARLGRHLLATHRHPLEDGSEGGRCLRRIIEASAHHRDVERARSPGLEEDRGGGRQPEAEERKRKVGSKTVNLPDSRALLLPERKCGTKGKGEEMRFSSPLPFNSNKRRPDELGLRDKAIAAR